MFNKYKFFIHESIKHSSREGNNIQEPENEIAFQTLIKICQMLGGKVVDNIRLSDICIINKLEKEYFPPGIKLLNQDFLIDALSLLKHPDLTSKKYTATQPQKKKK
jgi:hypothetical protein